MISALIRSNVVYLGVLPIGSNSVDTDPIEEQPNLDLHFPHQSVRKLIGHLISGYNVN